MTPHIAHHKALQRSNLVFGLCFLTFVCASSWLDTHAASPATVIHLDLRELSAVGPARVLAVDPCPPLDPLPPAAGVRHITARFIRHVDSTLDLHITGLDKPLGVTPNHPIWSDDRQSFIPAGLLQIDEHLRLITPTPGAGRVTAIIPRAGPTYVYNLEVHAEHAYAVTPQGVIVHNDCASTILGSNLMGGSERAAQTMRSLGLEAHHIVPRAKELVKQLNKHGIDINDAANGVWLEGPTIGGIHRRVNSKRYVKNVHKRLDGLNSPDDIRAELKKIGEELQDGTFPY